MKKAQLILAIITVLVLDFIAGSYYPIDKDNVTLQRTKQGLFIITNGNLYTVSLLVTDTDSYQKMERIR